MLQCHICNKPFTNPTSHTRHVKYCMRTHSRPKVRQKSCQTCSASKVKCTFQRPGCARCDKKGIGCVYDVDKVTTPSWPTSTQPAVRIGTSWTPGSTTQSSSPEELPVTEPIEVQPWQLSSSNDLIDWSNVDLLLPDDYASLDVGDFQLELLPELANYSAATSNSGSSDNISWPDILSPEPIQPNHQEMYFNQPASTPETLVNKPSPPQQHQHQYHHHHHHHLAPSLPRSPSPPEVHSTVLILRHNTLTTIPAFSQHSITTIIRGLRAYPLMMLQTSTFPPLIHSPSLHLSSSPSPPPSPTSASAIIARCMSIAHLYALRTPETTPYLWEAVLEQTNFFNQGLERRTLDKRGLMAALQAQLVYVIMRIVAQATTPTGFNFSVMLVYKRLCERFVDEYGYDPVGSCGEGERAMGTVRERWEDWGVNESWRRMKCIFFLVGKVVNVDMGASVKCTARYNDVNYIMLPCSRSQWEVKSAEEWEAQTLRYSSGGFLGGGHVSSRSRRLDTIGALLDAHHSALGSKGLGGGASIEALDRWNAEVDSLGSLLNASLGVS